MFVWGWGFFFSVQNKIALRFPTHISKCEPRRTFQGLVIKFQKRGEEKRQVTLLTAPPEGAAEIWQRRHPELASPADKNDLRLLSS